MMVKVKKWLTVMINNNDSKKTRVMVKMEKKVDRNDNKQ